MYVDWLLAFLGNVKFYLLLLRLVGIIANVRGRAVECRNPIKLMKVSFVK